jgi:beta-fructofuranosidase
MFDPTEHPHRRHNPLTGAPSLRAVSGASLEIEAVFAPEASAEFGLRLGCSPDGQLRLRVFLDRSVLEAFANRSTCLAGRLYPERSDSLGLELFARRGRVAVTSLNVWTLASTWE